MTYIIRLDDFPTGVRPLADLGNQRLIMDAFEARGIPFHVGIVPALLTKEHRWLTEYQYLIPCQHGYDHQYPKYSQMLKDDPKNHNTVGSFDEFDKVPYPQIKNLVQKGKQILNRFFATQITTYIPVCNITNNNLLRALKTLGFGTILTESPVRGLSCIKSDFYGRLADMEGSPEVVTLHLTWECDYIEAHGFAAWMVLFNKWFEDTQVEQASEAAPENQPTILFKMASRERPKKLIDVLNLYYKMMVGKEFRFVLTLDRDDKTANAALLAKLKQFQNLEVRIGSSKTKIQAMNADIPETGWDIVVLVSDDMIPKIKGFDNIIRRNMLKHYLDFDGVLWFSDGYQKTDVNTLSIMGKPYYDRFGYIYHPDYFSQRCDVEFQEVAESLNRQTYFDQVIIRHEHPAWGFGKQDKLVTKNMKSVVFDTQTYIERKKLMFPRGIPHVANFYHNVETPLSYLRYLTFQTFRHHHPDWTMRLYTGSSNTQTQWGGKERQDFTTYSGKDWVPELSALKVEIHPFDRPDLNPNYVSDVFRWEALKQGGWYFDTDQIFTGNFDQISWENDVVYGGRKHRYCGVVGACRGSELIKQVAAQQLQKMSNIVNYCDIGNWLFSDVVSKYRGQDKVLQTEDKIFYPVTDSHLVKDSIYSGKLDIAEIGGLAVHLFFGHPDSQAFNLTFDGKGTDSISKYLKGISG